MREFETLKDCSASLAREISTLLDKFLQSNPSATLALSGGRSPLALFGELSLKELSWDRINIALVDERLVPKSNSNSNTTLVLENLLQNRAKNARFIDFVGDLSQEIGEDENLDSKKMRDFLESVKSKFIQPDIAVLGLGADGHIASLFPREDLQFRSSELLVLSTPTHTKGVQNAPFARVSMSFYALINCQKLFLLISGEDKLNALKQTLDSKNPALYPLKYILDRKEVNVYYAKK